MKKKIFIVTFLICILLANLSFASYTTVNMSVVEEPVCTIELGNNSKFEKKLVSKDLANKEVTLQLQVTNGEEAEKPTGELIIVMDDSASMTKSSTVEGKTRKELIFNAANTLITNLLENNDKLKIGIVSFSTKSDEEEGTEEDAKIVSGLSNDVNSLTNAIFNIQTTGPRTNLEAQIIFSK